MFCRVKEAKFHYPTLEPLSGHKRGTANGGSNALVWWQHIGTTFGGPHLEPPKVVQGGPKQQDV